MERLKSSTPNPNVLLLVPVKDSSDTFGAWAEHILQLEPKPWKTIFCENDSKDDTLTWCQKFPLEKEIISFKLGKVKKKKGSKDWRYQGVGTARQKLLDRARELDPDYAIFLDVDLLIKTPDLIPAMTLWSEDIVGGTYVRDFPEGLMIATLFKNPTGLTKYRLRKKTKRVFEEVEATSGGCLCLSRKAIQDARLNFMPIRTGSSEDFGYCLKAKDLGYKIYLESTVFLVHRIRKFVKKPWRLTSEELKRYRALYKRK